MPTSLTARRTARNLLWLVIVPLLIVGAAGCGDDDDDDSFDAQQVVSDAADTLESASTFRFDLTHTNGSTELIQDMEMTEAEGEVARPESLRADLEVMLLGQLLEVAVVGIGDEVWISNPFAPSQWQLVPGTTATEVLDLTALPAVLRDVEDPEPNGTEEIDGQTHYRVRASVGSDSLDTVIPAAAEPGQMVEVEIWVGQDDSYTRRIVLSGPLNEDEPDDIERELNLSGFDDSITIEPPE